MDPQYMLQAWNLVVLKVREAGRAMVTPDSIVAAR